MRGTCEEVFSLTLFQKSRNSDRDCRFVKVVVLTNVGICRYRSKVTRAGVVHPGNLYVTSGTNTGFIAVFYKVNI